MSTTGERPFAPDYKTNAEYLFELARWYASQNRMPESSELASDILTVSEFNSFKERVFALMVGSEVSIKPGYWLIDLDDKNPVRLEGGYAKAIANASDISKSNPTAVYKLVCQYVHSLKTISERVGLIFEGEFYRR